MNKSNAMTNAQTQAGFLMLEVLITIVILALGLLGLAGLQAKIQTSETESYQRIQAILLLQDMTNRLSSGRLNAGAFITNAPLGTGDDQPTTCSTLTGASRDHCEWSQELKGAAEKQSGSAGERRCVDDDNVRCIGAMAGARGCIDLIAGSNPPVYRISVAWQGMTPLGTPSLPCGQDLYGAEGYRRVIAGYVPIANLSN